MIEIRTDPTPRELRWFGLALLAFFGILGGILRLHLGPNSWSPGLWTAGTLLVALYYAIPPLRRPVFVGWSYLTYPLGWLLSHLVLLGVFYLILTPIGLVRRLVAPDPMQRRFEPDRSSYWEPRPGPRPAERYFRQF